MEKKSESELMDRQLKVITIIFSSLSFLLLIISVGIGYLSVIRYDQMKDELNKSITRYDNTIDKYETRISNLESQITQNLSSNSNAMDTKFRNESLDLRANIKDNMVEMQNKINLAAGSILKVAKLEFYYDNKPLSNSVIGINDVGNIYIVNTGNKTIGNLSIVVHSNIFNSFNSVKSTKPGYSQSKHLSYPGVKIDPKETFYLFEQQNIFEVEDKKEDKILLEIFYGEEISASVEFTVKGS
jgi:cell division protein FtsL